ncbi:MAG: adenosylcobinamide-GDP ribazoletransferase, partial [Solirubrobacteraceae bacterium]
LGGGNTRERALAIMKDSRIGAFGAIGLLVLLGLKWSALVALPTAGFALIVVAAHVLSRWFSIGLIWALQYARADGEGKSRPFDGGLSAGGWLLSGAIGMAAVAIPAIGSGTAASTSLASAAAAGFAAAAGCAVVAAAYLKQRIGGYTGDCLGAVQQLSELTFLLGALAALRPAIPLS